MNYRSAGAGAATGRRRRRDGGRFIVLTGLSGAGKSQAIRALEDLGYFCVDNLPTELVPTLAELSRRQGAVLPKVAIVLDIREGGFLRSFSRIWRRLKDARSRAAVLAEGTLARRFERAFPRR